jgi:HlyD family secretion protein
MMIHKKAPLLGVMLMILLLVAACAPGRRAAQSQETAEGEVVNAFMGNLSAEASASGRVVAGREAALSANGARVTAVYVRLGQNVAAGEPLVQLDTADLALSVATAEQNVRLQEINLASLQEAARPAEVAAAEAAVASAEANLDNLLAGPTAAQLAVYSATVQSAQASLWSASAELSGSQNSVTASQIQQAEGALLAAQASLNRARDVNEANPTYETDQALRAAEAAVASAQANLDNLLAGTDNSAASASVAAASARLEGSQADYALQAAGATAAQIAAAEAQLAQAEASLAELVAGPTAASLRAAEAEVEQARLSLADAEDALAEATITAPFAGVVTAVYVSEGEIASGTVVEMVDNSQLEITLDVDEVEIGEMAVGQAAVVTLETWPDVEIESKIVAIAPGATADTGSALVTYEVRLSLEQNELPIRVGMTADARLTTAEREDVLLVPNRAIQVDRDRGSYQVELEDGTMVPVTIGLRDEQYTQITNGLEEGDAVVIRNAAPVETFEGGPGGGD